MVPSIAEENLDFTAELALAKRQVRETYDSLGFPGLVVKVEFRRMTSAMGYARYINGQITLSAPLWRRASVAERRVTVIHEACHIVAYVQACRNGRRLSRPHGHEWAALMHSCGLPATRCHDVPVAGLGRKTAVVYCSCKMWSVTPQRRARYLGSMGVRCRKCKTILQGTPYHNVPAAKPAAVVVAPVVVAKPAPAIVDREALKIAAFEALPAVLCCPKCGDDKPKGAFGMRVVPGAKGTLKAIRQSHCRDCR